MTGDSYDVRSMNCSWNSIALQKHGFPLALIKGTVTSGLLERLIERSRRDMKGLSLSLSIF